MTEHLYIGPWDELVQNTLPEAKGREYATLSLTRMPKLGKKPHRIFQRGEVGEYLGRLPFSK